MKEEKGLGLVLVCSGGRCTILESLLTMVLVLPLPVVALAGLWVWGPVVTTSSGLLAFPHVLHVLPESEVWAGSESESEVRFSISIPFAGPGSDGLFPVI